MHYHRTVLPDSATRAGSGAKLTLAEYGPKAPSRGCDAGKAIICRMADRLAAVEDALAGLTDAELRALIAASNEAPPVTYRLPAAMNGAAGLFVGLSGRAP
jgi:hypothetical protein